MTADTSTVIENIHSLIEKGDFLAAEKECEIVVTQQDENSYGWYLLGYSALRLNKIEKAKNCFGRAAQLNPQNPQYHLYYGNILRLNNEIDAAIDEFRKVIVLSPQVFEAHFNLACSLIIREEYIEAASILKELTHSVPEMAEIYFQWGVAARLSGDEETALGAYNKAIALKPGWAEAYYNLALLITQKKPETAIPLFEKALSLKPDWPQVYNCLGTAYQRLGVLDKATGYYLKAIEKNSDWHIPYHNLGEVFILKNKTVEAIRYFRESIKRNPDFANSHFNLGILLLKQGMFREGWQEYEWRLAERQDEKNIKNGARIWNGVDFDGRTIVVRPEQGLGDSIQFVRYARLIQQRGAKVWLQSFPQLARLFETCPGVDRVIIDLPPAVEFDFQVSLLSLPRIFGTVLETIPADVPYLSAPPCDDAARCLINKYNSLRLKIGIVWRSGDNYINHEWRDCRPEDFHALARLPQVALFSLQFNPFAHESEELKKLGIEDLSAQLGDLATTAAIVREMDLVITVDTAMAHLAGALGKPVWTLLNYIPDWRWLTGRDNSPWYPGMVLFRQELPGDWSEVFKRVEDRLKVLLRDGRVPAILF